MENQHRQIVGYRELEQSEIDRMNAVKELERVTLESLAEFAPYSDPRWLEHARQTLEAGFMFAGRAMVRPNEAPPFRYGTGSGGSGSGPSPADHGGGPSFE